MDEFTFEHPIIQASKVFIEEYIISGSDNSNFEQETFLYAFVLNSVLAENKRMRVKGDGLNFSTPFDMFYRLYSAILRKELKEEELVRIRTWITNKTINGLTDTKIDSFINDYFLVTLSDFLIEKYYNSDFRIFNTNTITKIKNSMGVASKNQRLNYLLKALEEDVDLNDELTGLNKFGYDKRYVALGVHQAFLNSINNSTLSSNLNGLKTHLSFVKQLSENLYDFLIGKSLSRPSDPALKQFFYSAVVLVLAEYEQSISLNRSRSAVYLNKMEEIEKPFLALKKREFQNGAINTSYILRSDKKSLRLIARVLYPGRGGRDIYIVSWVIRCIILVSLYLAFQTIPSFESIFIGLLQGGFPLTIIGGLAYYGLFWIVPLYAVVSLIGLTYIIWQKSGELVLS